MSVPFLHLQKKPARRRYENYGMYSDDDANSDASSACSERSYSSRNGGAIPTYMRQTEDVAEVGGNSSTAENSVNHTRALQCILSWLSCIGHVSSGIQKKLVYTTDHIHKKHQIWSVTNAYLCTDFKWINIPCIYNDQTSALVTRFPPCSEEMSAISAGTGSLKFMQYLILNSSSVPLFIELFLYLTLKAMSLQYQAQCFLKSLLPSV